ncbi:Nucleolar protein 16 [Cladobotryum mycophilum]|uniref:Nucleolar protein 16 n=1 Tax=Cladobotryum mycophilum TaxID=491253 RepID=A0ABR0SNF1_9HYPO
MGRELQKKKRRSGRAPVRGTNKTKKILNPRGNNIIAKNWDKKETLAQNYRRLGLLARLKAPTGGTEKKLDSAAALAASASSETTTQRRPSRNDPFAIATTEKAIVSEARVERDERGHIIRILSRSNNPLNDPLNALDSDSEADGDEGKGEEEAAEEWGGIHDDGVGTTDIVKSLIEQARNPAPPKERYQSHQEKEWLESLIAKYGEDTRAMARDRRLNPMQQTAADIGRRIKKLQG